MNDLCPHCGQRVFTRLGVILSRKQADIFDMIRARRANEQIYWVLFPNSSKRAAFNALKAHVWQINSRLAETDFQIRGDRNGHYVIERGLAE